VAGGEGIPNSPPRHPHHSHIDTNYLIPLLFGRDAGSGAQRDIYERAHALVEHPDVSVPATSLVAVGEAFTLIAEGGHGIPSPDDGSRPPSTRLGELVRGGKLAICWADHQNPAGQVLVVAEEVRHRASVGPADALIVASALLCRDCVNLYTTDSEQIRNPKLYAYCHSGGRSLNIAEAPPPNPRR
jgi:hypothetical protein